ncbi:MAG TPA: septation protein SepH, partial [Actinomycetota bacterium]|nr:septation protein SepH [Actinomycetota bacterium]
MVKLRVIGTSADNAELILSNKKKGRTGSHAVAIDKRLLGVLQKAVYARRQMTAEDENGDRSIRASRPAIEPKIPPREIQRLLRAGMSPQHVAREAEVDLEYVDQFLQMVLYERAGIVGEAQQLYLEKSRLGPSSLPLGDAVRTNLNIRRVRMSEEQFAASWTATRQEGQPWSVIFAFPFRGRTRKATWRFDPRARTMVAANKLAADMGWVLDGNSRPTVLEAPTRPQRSAPRRKP